LPPKPGVAPKAAAAANPGNADTGLPFDAFYTQLTKNIIYPREARDNHIAGTIYLTFTVSADNKAQDIKVLKGLGSGIDEATVRALKKCTTPAEAKTDMTYVIPVSFNLVDRSGKPGPHLSGDQNVPTLQSNQVLLKAIIISATIPSK
jgi:TonB family protein